MTIRRFMLAVCLAVAPVTILAQGPSMNVDQPQRTASGQAADPGQPTRGSTPPTVAVPAPPRREGQPINVKVEVTITDHAGAAQALKKTVTVVTGDNMSGFIRSIAGYDAPIGPVPLNVDIEPQVLSDNRIRLRLNLQYNLPSSEGMTTSAPSQGPRTALLRSTEIRENLALILENGKPLVAAQSADPVGDRQVTIEVKATVLR